MIALDSIEIIDKDNIQVSWFDNGNNWGTWDSGELFSHIVEQYDEIERLNNIMNELEKWLKEDTEKSMMTMETGRAFNMFDILDKIKELKGSDKE